MQDTTASAPRGLILLSQPGQLRLTPEDMFHALPKTYKGPTLTVDLDLVELARQAIQSRDFGPAQRALEEQVRDKLAPLREKHPDYRLVYFGSSAIPLTVLLGFLLETWWPIEVIPHHHVRRAWAWFTDDGQKPARLAEVKLPDYRDQTPGEVIIRVSTSHIVDRQVTLRAVPEPLLEIDIALEQPSEDAFTCLEEMHAVAKAFRSALDLIGDNFINVYRVHLFASVQPGMALLLGAQISTTMHPPVQTYQYERHADDGPYHVPAILVPAPSRPAPPVLREEEIARAQQDRERLHADLERMKAFARRSQGTRMQSWIAEVLSKTAGYRAFSGVWLHLPRIHDTPLPNTSVDVHARSVEDSFRLTPGKVWQIDDHWLARLAKRIPADDERRCALRQLVLHEAVHRGRQTLTRTSSQDIGRFPKVLEEIDYHADVWTMLYEYALTEVVGSEAANPQQFFMDMVRLATETMWAFDDDGTALSRIQIRRLNRYLVWYWQYLHLARETGPADPMTLDDVLEILAEKPVLELAGPLIVARDRRIYFELDGKHVATPEIAIYHHGALHRHGARSDFPILSILEGVRLRDGERILGVLRAAFEQTVRS